MPYIEAKYRLLESRGPLDPNKKHSTWLREPDSPEPSKDVSEREVEKPDKSKRKVVHHDMHSRGGTNRRRTNKRKTNKRKKR